MDPIFRQVYEWTCCLLSYLYVLYFSGVTQRKLSCSSAAAGITLYLQLIFQKFSTPTRAVAFSSSERFVALPPQLAPPTPKTSLTFSMVTAAAQIPHPAKAETGGEDSFCVSANSLAVSDGVGGWQQYGVDPSQFSRSFVRHAYDFLSSGPAQCFEPENVLRYSYDRLCSEQVQGGGTACVLSLHNRKLKAAMIGDTAFLVIRNGKIIFRSPTQQHYFNCPYQLSSHGGDLPCDMQTVEYPVRENDIIITATDGLFDNVFDHEILYNLQQQRIRYRTVQNSDQIAILTNFVRDFSASLSYAAFAASQKRDVDTPFSIAARTAGYNFVGGKEDDITVLVSVVTKHESAHCS